MLLISFIFISIICIVLYVKIPIVEMKNKLYENILFINKVLKTETTKTIKIILTIIIPKYMSENSSRINPIIKEILIILEDLSTIEPANNIIKIKFGVKT